ncbi:hypothetical protein [Frankia sp. CiP3]|uniref:hypothetical protein n=1 Tax=Frankia sp. CiP3 TaxID=2880971 RepID=UPI001EF6E8DB|nr:hypothetical protein [Frankia sp. CiP3]
MMMPTPPSIRMAVTAAGLLAVTGLAAGCGGDATAAAKPLPAIETFQAGTCRDAAAGLVDTLRIARKGNDKPDGIKLVATDLIAPQEKLYDQIPTAGEFAPDLERITTAIGFLRLRVDTSTYEPKLLTEVTTTTEALVNRCTSGR